VPPGGKNAELDPNPPPKKFRVLEEILDAYWMSVKAALQIIKVENVMKLT
jgi:hypothetical protein